MCLLGMLSGVSCAPWCNGSGSAPLPLPPSCFALGRNFWVVMPLFRLILASWHARMQLFALGGGWQPGPALWGALDPHLDRVHRGDIC